jgi:Glycogen debranching enzyme
LLGFYLEAYLKVFGMSGVSFSERMLISMEEEMSLHCIGTIPELFDGNPPFTGRGAISFAMNVASILRVLDLLKKYNAE